MKKQTEFKYTICLTFFKNKINYRPKKKQEFIFFNIKIIKKYINLIFFK